MSVKTEISYIAIYAKADNLREYNVNEYMVIYIQTQTMSMFLYLHYRQQYAALIESTGIISLYSPYMYMTLLIFPLEYSHWNINRVREHSLNTNCNTYLILVMDIHVCNMKN